MDSPRQPPYDVSELEQWLEGVEIHRNPGLDDPYFFINVMAHPDLDYYSAKVEWDDGRVTVVTARKKTLFPIRSKYGEGFHRGMREDSYWRDFWRGFNIPHLMRPYFAWTPTYNPDVRWSEIEDAEARQRAYCEQDPCGYLNAPAKKIFKLMKRLYKAQK